MIENYLNSVENEKSKELLKSVIKHILDTFPTLDFEIKWDQAMFLNNGTFIFAISHSKNHFSLAPEKKTMDLFRKEIEDAGYSQGKMLFRINWTDSINYKLIDKMISFNIEDKKDTKTFWRK